MPSLTQWRRQVILANMPSTPQISLPSRSGHIALRCCDFLPIYYPCDYPFALRRLPQWNFVLLAVKCHGISPLSTAVRAIHRSLWPAQISKTMFRVHACGLWDLNVICEILRLITLRSRLEVCEKELSIFFPVALRRPPRLLVNPRPLVNPQPGFWMFSSRRRRVSRQASPFLSLPHQSMFTRARIHWLNSRKIICFLARGHVILFPSGWIMFC